MRAEEGPRPAWCRAGHCPGMPSGGSVGEAGPAPIDTPPPASVKGTGRVMPSADGGSGPVPQTGCWARTRPLESVWPSQTFPLWVPVTMGGSMLGMGESRTSGLSLRATWAGVQHVGEGTGKARHMSGPGLRACRPGAPGPLTAHGSQPAAGETPSCPRCWAGAGAPSCHCRPRRGPCRPDRAEGLATPPTFASCLSVRKGPELTPSCLRVGRTGPFPSSLVSRAGHWVHARHHQQ